MATLSPSVPEITSRYILQSELGRGGMGVVYRALDRLTQQHVALKRVSLPSSRIDSTDRLARHQSQDYRRALAREFRTLASLRHPNIISVLDYGFDGGGQPFYTMEILEDAPNILEAGRDKPLLKQMELLVQVLQALAYLHRRGIIHRDLKPDNVLVVEERVKVLDFGLAIAQDYIADAAAFVGTVAYAAPEVIRGQAATAASDLYAVGVMAVEMISGRYPYQRDQGTGMLLTEIISSQPDLSQLDTDERLRATLIQLLSKEPKHRPDDAVDLIAAYAEATDQAIPRETELIRESYLQAADFIGRSDALNQLITALGEARQGFGGLWLVGGESGVGKSRLVDELRIQALVDGGLVLFGQAVSEGAAPYRLWRDILRYLSLQTDLTDLEASVLKALVPDIATLIKREVSDAPDIDPAAAQDRLIAVVENVFRRQGAPIVVILEDLHWAHESLAILARVAKIAPQLPLLMIGTYRNDEQPDLPSMLTEMADIDPVPQVIELERLNYQEIAELSVAMLGEAIGRKDQVLSLLQRETEGNVYFIVEVVRILAEEAGELALVGERPLPENMFVGGIRTVVQRRLARVADNARPLLRIAAVIGRDIDTLILNRLITENPVLYESGLDDWLTTCASAMILERNVGASGEKGWRFGHDKLREGLLADIAAEESRVIHLNVAKAIEAVYPDQASQLTALAYHWRLAGDLVKEASYSYRAGEQTLANGAYVEAATFLQRSLELAPQVNMPTSQQAHIARLLGDAYHGAGRLSPAAEYYDRALELLGWPFDNSRAGLMIGLVRELLIQGIHRTLPRPLWFSGKDNPDARVEASQAYQQHALRYYLTGDPIPGIYAILRATNLAEGVEPSAALARVYSSSAIAASVVPIHLLAERYFELANALPLPPGEDFTRSWVTLREGMYATGTAQWQRAEETLARSAVLADNLGQRRLWEEATGTRAYTRYYQGLYRQAHDDFEDVYHSANRRGDIREQIVMRFGKASASMRLADFAEAMANLKEAEALLKQDPYPSRTHQVGIYGSLAAAHLGLGNRDEAVTVAVHATEIIESGLPTAFYALEGYAAVAEVYLRLWEVADELADLPAKTEQACRNLRRYSRVFPIASPRHEIYWGVYQALSGHQDKAQQHWRKGLEVAQKMLMPFEQGLALYEMGRHLSPGDPARRQKLEQALLIFDRLGVPNYRSQAEDALRAL
ncbi:MAG: protein kinase [Chloroflexi bacterium]|nr:protein kinase [Chloroflexota bacterium]